MSLISYSDFHKSVYSQDTPKGEAHGWIQWKGTDACIDLHCSCGHHGHFDGGFFYNFQCPMCGVKYAVGQTVRLIPLTDEEAAFVDQGGACGFKTCELDQE